MEPVMIVEPHMDKPEYVDLNKKLVLNDVFTEFDKYNRNNGRIYTTESYENALIQLKLKLRYLKIEKILTKI